MQPDPLSPQEVKQPEPSLAQETKAPRRSILPMFLIILLLAVAGLGFWAYQLNTNLTATQQQLTTLQEDHDKLQSDYENLKSGNEKLTTDLDQSRADFEKTKGELTTAQIDLKKSQDQNKSLNAKIDLARKKAEILYAASTVKSATDFLQVDTLIKATNDTQLLTQWNKFAASPTAEGSFNFLLYLISSIGNDLK